MSRLWKIYIYIWPATFQSNCLLPGFIDVQTNLYKNHLWRAITCEEQPPLKHTVAFYINLKPPATSNHTSMSQQSSEPAKCIYPFQKSCEQRLFVQWICTNTKYITNTYLLFIIIVFISIYCYRVHVCNVNNLFINYSSVKCTCHCFAS